MVNLTIGGGNFKGISYIGALEYLYKNNLINKIENFYGTSIGTIIGIFFLIGFKPFEIFKILVNLDFNNFWDFEFSNLEKHFSLITDKLFKKINEIFSTRENPNITFIEFYNKYNVKLNFFATSLYQRKNICFNIENASNINVLKVLQASCSIPIIFPPVKINNEFYIDGCIKSIDGICNKLCYDDTINFIIKGNYSATKEIKSFKQYITSVIDCTLQNEEQLDNEYTILIRTPSDYEGKYNFNDISSNDKIKLFYHGLMVSKNKMDNKIQDIQIKINYNLIKKNMITKNINNDINNEYENKNEQSTKITQGTQTDFNE